METPVYRVRVKDGVNINAITVGIIERHLNRKTGSAAKIERNYENNSLEIYLRTPAELEDDEIKYLSNWGIVEEAKKKTVN